MERLVALANSVWQLFLTLSPITQFGVAMLFVCALIAHLFKYNEHTVHEGPSIFTTAGIFFTFLGIAEGLYQFDPQKIDLSIPTLLDGLKTAFVASVVGVGAALSLKLRYAMLGVKHSNLNAKPTGATADDLYDQLVNVRESLVGSHDDSLISQLKLARQDSNDRLDALSRSQSAFMQKLTENNSKALITALQEVIRDFNTKITEQFGDNFKQLNQAVGAMLEWQARYREQISEMIGQQARAAQNMEIASSRYEKLITNSENFVRTADSLCELLDGLERQRNQITESLEHLGTLLEKTSDGLPKIESKVAQLTDQITFGVKQNQDEMTKVLRESTIALRTSVTEIGSSLFGTIQSANTHINNHVRTLADKTSEQLEQVTLGVKQNQDQMTKVLRDSTAELQSSVSDIRNLLLEVIQSANTQINDHVRALADKTSEQFSKLDAALETELSKSISSLGRQLTALSKQFVDDYSPLTDRLRAMVQIGRG